MENYFNNHKTFIYLLVIFFALFIGTTIFIFMNSSPNKVEKKEETNITEKRAETITSIVATEGTMTLETAKTDISSTDQEISIDVVVDSSGKNIAGYDLALNYDPIAFDFVSATSNLPDFKIYSYNRGDHISLLGTKTLQTQLSTVFSKTNIISLVFKPNKKGSFSFSLKSEIGKDKTDLVTDKTEILNPALSQMTVNVK